MSHVKIRMRQFQFRSSTGSWPATLRATAYAIACRRVFLQEIGLG